MAETLAKYQLDETTDKKEEIKMSLEEAIKIIQVNNIGRLFCLIEFWKNVKKRQIYWIFFTIILKFHVINQNLNSNFQVILHYISILFYF